MVPAYHNGWGVKRDYEKSAQFLLRSLEVGAQFSVKEMANNSSGWNIAFRKSLQSQLSEKGYFKGKANGKFGPDTQAAVRKAAGQ